MRKRTRSILEELNNVVHDRDKNHMIESRGEHIIRSAINLIEEIYNTYDEETATILRNKLLNSIKNRDENKYIRSVRKASKS
ncbi:MAG: hypothetical protein H8D23_31800 [Candidatus Brocadiales bacterium]|nr:hypothetical protein [Candidatus Brocadiales bacterium]